MGTNVEKNVSEALSALSEADADLLRLVAIQQRLTAATDHLSGAVITEAGNDPNVAALVYVAAFAPDKGESVNNLIEGFPKDGPQPPILPPRDGFLFLDREKFHDSLAANVDVELAAFMADSQVPWGVDALGATISEAAWATKPSWYLITTDDRMIPPGPAGDVRTNGRNRRGGSGEPFGLRIAARSRC